MTGRNPTVSIIMPTYNNAEYIESAIKGLLGQSFWDFELIVVSDGADEETDKIMVHQTDRRLRYIPLEHGNDFGIRALNYGLSVAKGEFLTMASSDNIYFSPLISTLLHALDDMGADFAYGDFLQLKQDGGTLYEFVRPAHLAGDFKLENLRYGYTMGICFLYRKTLYDEVGAYRVSPCADYDFVVRAALRGKKFIHVESILGINRKHDRQVSQKDTELEEGRIKDMIESYLRRSK